MKQGIRFAVLCVVVLTVTLSAFAVSSEKSPSVEETHQEVFCGNISREKKEHLHHESVFAAQKSSNTAHEHHTLSAETVSSVPTGGSDVTEDISPAEISVIAEKSSSEPPDTSDTVGIKSEPAEESSEEPIEIYVDKAANEKVQKMLRGTLRKNSVLLDVEQLYQYPVLPTGCESVSLTMALNYLGEELSLTEIAENYLLHSDNMAVGFCGDPFDEGGAGIYPPGLILAAQRYIDEKGCKIAPIDTTGTELKDLYKLMQSGYPVILWSTSALYDPYTDEDDSDVKIEFNGKQYLWYTNEHCVVLSGYDTDNNTVTVNDPEIGCMVYDTDRFQEIYDATGRLSIVLLKYT